MGNDISVIDHFLDVFSRYIDSGFGLISGDVGFLVTVLIGIDATLAAFGLGTRRGRRHPGFREEGPLCRLFRASS